MNRAVGAIVLAALALWMSFVSYAKAQNCNTGGTPSDNVAMAWGGNYVGQLGDGTIIERHEAVRVQNLTGLITVSAGGAHNLALKNDCTVWAWGQNANGQLGDGTTIERHLPVLVANLNGVTAISGGYSHSLALKSDGTVWGWGWNMFGQLGDGTNIDRDVPVQVANLSGVIAIAAGNANHNLALKNDGTLWAWGENFYGQLGDGTTVHRNTPVRVGSLTGVTSMAVGFQHSLARMNDSTVRAWGANANGELGDGTTIERHSPVEVIGGQPIVSASPSTASPIIIPPPPPPWSYLTRVNAVAAGLAYSLALMTDGTLRAWGSNDFGQLGDGTNFDRHTPVQVPNVSGVIDIGTGDVFSLAVRSNAIVQAWGQNMNGQLGDGTTIDRPYPVQVAGLVESLAEVRAIGGGVSHGLAAGSPLTLLTIRKILVHPDHNRLRLFNLKIDGATVVANINGGSTGPQRVSPGTHTVSETGGTATPLTAFHRVIGGDCAPDGTINLATGDNKTCTITNYDHWGGCASGSICCEPGDGTQGCMLCRPSGACP